MRHMASALLGNIAAPSARSSCACRLRDLPRLCPLAVVVGESRRGRRISSSTALPLSRAKAHTSSARIVSVEWISGRMTTPPAGQYCASANALSAQGAAAQGAARARVWVRVGARVVLSRIQAGPAATIRARRRGLRAAYGTGSRQRRGPRRQHHRCCQHHECA